MGTVNVRLPTAFSIFCLWLTVLNGMRALISLKREERSCHNSSKQNAVSSFLTMGLYCSSKT
jgi:hypothetical protein